jgi:hypothetical protein
LEDELFKYLLSFLLVKFKYAIEIVAKKERKYIPETRNLFLKFYVIEMKKN